MEETKICIKCGGKLILSKFYKHLQSRDGYLNKCIECTKNEVKLRQKKLKEKPEWVGKEKTQR